MQNPHLSESTLFYILVPLAILICTLMVPRATTGGGLVTAYKDRKSAARFKSDASYSHWTWRLKTPYLSVRLSPPECFSYKDKSFSNLQPLCQSRELYSSVQRMWKKIETLT